MTSPDERLGKVLSLIALTVAVIAAVVLFVVAG